MSDNVPCEVLDAFGLHNATLSPISIGWVNCTLRVDRGDERFILQRLHPVFTGEVNRDIDAVTRHLERAGLRTPRIVPTVDGALWVDMERPWRMLTFLEGEITDTIDTLTRAHSAGVLAGRFHRALANLEHTFAFTRPDAHDTPVHLARLRAACSIEVPEDRARIDELTEAILAYELPRIPELPTRIVHGDLKATNLIFQGDEAVALVDLDTIAHGTIAVDMGDALRSWCNLAGESSLDATFDQSTFCATMAGYASIVRGWLTPEEMRAIVPAIETIALELAARFATDFYEQRYFGFDGSRYSSRRAHNLVRTEAQLSLAGSVHAQRDPLASFVGSLDF